MKTQFRARPSLIGLLPALALAAALNFAAAGARGAEEPAGPIDFTSAIQEVLSGQRKVAEAHWWGFNPEDATQPLQAAIRSGAKTVRVRRMESPWIVDEIELASDQELVFEPGVVVLAKAGKFQGGNDSLFTAAGRRNVRLTGPGATLQMRRADYAAPPYSKAEWRHVLNLRSCTNVTVTGLTLAESGGDGIYLGVDRSGGPNDNISIREVICRDNYRQGISVISARNLLIEDCVLRGTAGTAPAAGIDFEPNRPGESLVNCVMRRCVSQDNEGLGYHFYLGNLAPTSPPVSIRLEDCLSRGTNRQSLNVYLPMHHSAGAVPGRIEFINCRFEDRGHAGITISKPAPGARLQFQNCVLSDPAPRADAAAPITLRARAGARWRLGGIEFVNFKVQAKADRPLLELPDGTGVPLSDISGELIRVDQGQTEKLALDNSWLAKVSPPDPFFDLPTVPPDLEQLPPPVSWPVVDPLPPHRLRGSARLAFQARAQEEVRLSMRFQAVGRSPADKPLTATVTSPSGNVLRRVVGELGQEVIVAFTAPDAGIYQLRSEAGRHTATVATSSHPICLLGQDGLFHFIHTTCALAFLVPDHAGDFGLRVTGGGGEELVQASLFDPTGREVWHEDAIGSARSFVAGLSGPGRNGWWQLRMERPSRGVLEDHFVELRGVPAVLFFTSSGPHRSRSQ